MAESNQNWNFSYEDFKHAIQPLMCEMSQTEAVLCLQERFVQDMRKHLKRYNREKNIVTDSELTQFMYLKPTDEQLFTAIQCLLEEPSAIRGRMLFYEGNQWASVLVALQFIGIIGRTKGQYLDLINLVRRLYAMYNGGIPPRKVPVRSTVAYKFEKCILDPDLRAWEGKRQKRDYKEHYKIALRFLQLLKEAIQ